MFLIGIEKISMVYKRMKKRKKKEEKGIWLDY